jgi:hypothetical protein
MAEAAVVAVVLAAAMEATAVEAIAVEVAAPEVTVAALQPLQVVRQAGRISS